MEPPEDVLRPFILDLKQPIFELLEVVKRYLISEPLG